MFSPDRTSTEIAERQRGLVTRAQALKSGFTEDQVQHRLHRGLWSQVHEGVYRIGGSPASVDQARLAAVLAVGPDAAVSHRAAADVWGLWWSKPPIVEITTARSQSPELDGVSVHRLADLSSRWIVAVDGVPVTTVTRTLVDLGAVMPAKLVAKCVDRATGRQLVTAADIDTARRAVARQGRRGAGVIRRVLAPRLACGPVAGVFEARMARLLASQGLPTAVPQHEVFTTLGEFVARVDFAYPELELAIEVDGFEAHSSLDAFRHDRSRQNALVAEGWTVLRFVWPEVDRNSPTVGRTIRAARQRLAA